MELRRKSKNSLREDPAVKRYAYRVKLIVKDPSNEEKYEVISTYNREYLEDSYNFSKAKHEVNEKYIREGHIMRDLNFANFQVTQKTTLDSKWFLVEKNEDEEKEYLLATISGKEEDNLEKEKKLRKEDHRDWRKGAGGRKRRHSRPLREQYYFRSQRKEKQDGGEYKVVSEKIFRCSENDDFKEVLTWAQDYHFAQVEEIEGYDGKVEMENLEKHGQFQHPVRYRLEIVEIVDPAGPREINHLWLENNEGYSPGVHLDIELRRKYYAETSGRGQRLILDMDLWT